MNAETVTRAIQLILAPVGMVTTCAISLGGLLTRYGVINDRLRLLNRERLDLLHALRDEPDAYTRERLTEIDAQVPGLLHRLNFAQRAVFMAYGAILIFVLDMFAIAALAATGRTWIATLALAVFLGGTATLFAGVLAILLEVRSSAAAIAYEVARVRKIERFPLRTTGEIANDP